MSGESRNVRRVFRRLPPFHGAEAGIPENDIHQANRRDRLIAKFYARIMRISMGKRIAKRHAVPVEHAQRQRRFCADDIFLPMPLR